MSLYERAQLAKETPNWSLIAAAYRRCFVEGKTTESIDEFAVRYLKAKDIIYSKTK